MLSGSDEIFANTIRRMIIEEVPTLAVENLEIKDNNSALFDEMLGLRLGLLPIKTDLKSYELKEKCKCKGEGCARCELNIHLKAGKKGFVYAEEAKSADPKCKFVQPKMPVVKLLPKQKVDVTMTAILGNGKMHTKWSPGLAFYKSAPVLKLGKVKDPKAVVEKCSDGVFTLRGNTLSVAQDKVLESQLLEYYASLDKGISLEYSDDFIFTVESWGQLSCKDMLNKSGELLVEKAEEMEKLV